MTQEKIALFIDGSNFHATTKLMNLDIDYIRLLEYFKGLGTLIRPYYYTALPDSTEVSNLKRLIDFLDYNGYMIVSKSTKSFVNSYLHKLLELFVESIEKGATSRQSDFLVE